MADNYNLSVSASELNTAITKANAAAPQSTTYTKAQVDAALTAKLNTADVDDALSSTSTDPVQNKVVYAELESIKASARVLTLDVTAFTSLTAYADTFGNGTYSFLVPNNNTLLDVPMNNANAIVKITVYSAGAATMEFWPISSAYPGQLFTQIKSAGIWRGWYKFEGTAVT